MAEAIVPWRELEQRGFPPLATMSDAAVWWFARFYRDRLPQHELQAFYESMTPCSAARTAWVAQHVAAIDPHAAVRIVRAAQDTLTCDPRACARAVAALRRIAAPDAVAVAEAVSAQAQRMAGTLAACAPLAAALDQWRAAHAVQHLPWLLRELRAAQTNTAVAAHAARLVRTTLGAAPPSNVTLATAATLRDTVTRDTWPLYIMALEDVTDGGRTPQLCVPPARLAQIGFPPFAQMSVATVLWLEQYYARFGDDAQRTSFYQHIAGITPQWHAWAEARRAALAPPDNRHSSTNIPTM
jgi:hypothetical protein